MTTGGTGAGRRNAVAGLVSLANSKVASSRAGKAAAVAGFRPKRRNGFHVGWCQVSQFGHFSAMHANRARHVLGESRLHGLYKSA